MSQYYEREKISLNNRFLSCNIDEKGNIFANNGTGNMCIGVSIEVYQELENALQDTITIAENYKNQLIEHGIIEKELTPQEENAILKEEIKEIKKMLLEMQTNKIVTDEELEELTAPKE